MHVYIQYVCMYVAKFARVYYRRHRRGMRRGLCSIVNSSWVCVSVKSHLSPTERLFVLKILSHTQRATKVKKVEGICLKRLRSRVRVKRVLSDACILGHVFIMSNNTPRKPFARSKATQVLAPPTDGFDLRLCACACAHTVVPAW